MEKLIEVHPVLRKLPQHIKPKLVVSPESDFNVMASWLTCLPCLQVRPRASHLLERGINKEEMAMRFWRLTSKEAHTTKENSWLWSEGQTAEAVVS